MTKSKKLMALLLVLAMLFAVVTVIAACDKHECKHVCETCGKCTDATCTDPACKDKCPGHETAHVCGHKCPTCGKCLDETCTDPVCADKCQGHQQAGLEAGDYNIVLRDETNSLVWYATGAIGSKGGLLVSHSGTTVAVLTVIYENDKYTLKIGSQYLEAYLNGTYKNMRLVNTPSNDAIEWKWSTEYDTFCATYSDETRYLGGNYYNGQVDDLYDNAVTLAKEYYFENNPVVIHYEKYVPAPPVEVESVSFNTKRDTLYLLPVEKNFIELTATVQPANAPQDIVWTVDKEDMVTFSSGSYVGVKFGRVTYKGQTGTITLTATAKDTDKSASVTIVIQDREGTKQDDPITVDEAIALIASTDQYVKGDDSNETHGFYITGTVAAGSKRVSGGWEFSLLGSDDKTLVCSVKDDQLEKDGITIPLKADGGLDGSQIIFYAASMHNDNGVYSASVLTSMNTIKSLQLPVLTAIEIEAEQTEVTVPYSVEITVKSITPANAVFENVEWLTSDETKATVTGDESKATVTSVAAGEVKISVRCANITSNEITLTISEEQTAVKVIYDWTSALEGKVCDSTLYSQRDPREMITEINQWTPGQQEIKSFVTEGTMYDSIEAPGIAYIPAKRLIAGQITIQTLHEIKKVTFKVVPFADATTTQLSVNTISKTHEKGDSIYTGDPSSAIDIVFELTEATTTLNVEATGVAGNSFAIVGITLEQESVSSNSFEAIWTSALEGKICDSTLYSQRDPREMITEINQWTPGQQEIKSFVTEGTMYDSIEAPGIAYIPAKRLIAGQITIQTLHEIKKVTFKVVPFADATTTQLSVNTISKTHEKGDSIYTGDPSSAIDIVFELTEATTTLNVEATGVAGNSFAIVGMTLEW